jgi:hypothetical protein
MQFLQQDCRATLREGLDLVRETTESESQNYGYKFGQEEETYNIVAPRLLRSPDLPIRLLQQQP